ncbi:ABC transporter ATP-binding protein [Sphaerisporangium krabiense]|uniref:ATP-binding cassette subfamily B protein n=1 Tax=Sphaerisporangium krabiense TaxID=763782 RepID=A0A7W8Z4S5_9ACTN|nr:ABC transporter ATP-binding protein [Sphaerisporangium krabiense]MBB5627377.1 ATP-binding cassette subfamily B protein [Sphaerisporangium krabiense]GII64487.1 ABC transporter ATP-binding protein [Sphaerisporangium krabiense]
MPSSPGPHGTARAADRLLVAAALRAPGWGITLVVAAVGGVVCALLLPAALSAALDGVLAGTTAAAWNLAALLTAAALCAVASTVAGAACGAAAVSHLRVRLLGHVLALGPARAARFAPGDLTSRLTAGAAEAAQAPLAVTETALKVVSAVCALVALTLLDWRLALTLLVTVPVGLIIVRRFMTRASDLFTRYQELQGRIAAGFAEAIGGVRTIRASATLPREAERILAPLPELAATGRATWRFQRDTAWQAGLLLAVVELAVLTVAGLGVASGRLTAGALLAATGYTALVMSVLDEVDSLLGVAKARAAARRVADVLAEPAPAPGGLPLAPGPPAVTFEDVTVTAGERTVLDGVSAVVPAGSVCAVVGRSGEGKSLLAALAGGLAEPASGRVLLDGVPVQDIDPGHLRRHVAYAFARPALLGATITDLITYAAPQAPAPATTTDAEAVAAGAARVAAADAFVRRLPGGYATPPMRAMLSGGETQRLGLARAVAQDAPLVILDDATSSLDTATEAQVSAALASAFTGRTQIVVAHRAATAARADLVLWLEDGHVRASGPHHELMAIPAYRSLFQIEEAA